jgi:integrase
MAKQLTAAAVEKFTAGKARREIPDAGCPGLYLLVQPTGFKSFALRFRRPNGDAAKLTLGPLSKHEAEGKPIIGMPLTLRGARLLAVELQRERALGKDIVAVRKREKLEIKAKNGRTFGGAAIDYIERHAMRETRRWPERARLLGLRPNSEGSLEVIPKGLGDRWRDRPLGEITGDDIFGIVDEAREHGTPGLERRVDGPSENRAMAMFATLSSMFSWLLSKRRVSANPCAGVARPKVAESRDRVLKDSELVAFWKAASAERKEFAAPLKLLLLTGQRLNEVVGMRRSELSDDTWIIPRSRTKNGREHVVPLSPLARDILGSVESIGEYVFTTNGRTAVAIGSKIKRRLDAAMKIEPWRLHDIRRSVVTGLAELGVRPDVIELVVNHVSGHRGGIAGVYNRSELLPERRAALERWSTHVAGLIEGKAAKVVPLRAEA